MISELFEYLLLQEVFAFCLKFPKCTKNYPTRNNIQLPFSKEWSKFKRLIMINRNLQLPLRSSSCEKVFARYPSMRSLT